MARNINNEIEGYLSSNVSDWSYRKDYEKNSVNQFLEYIWVHLNSTWVDIDTNSFNDTHLLFDLYVQNHTKSWFIGYESEFLTQFVGLWNIDARYKTFLSDYLNWWSLLNLTNHPSANMSLIDFNFLFQIILLFHHFMPQSLPLYHYPHFQ